MLDVSQKHTKPHYCYCLHDVLKLLTSPGLGCALLERLRDDYPAHLLLSIAVAPFASGETPLQHYNSLLCLSWLQQYADAVLLFQNDLILKHVSKSAAKAGDPLGTSVSVSMEDLNGHISHTLCNSFLPLWSSERYVDPCTVCVALPIQSKLWSLESFWHYLFKVPCLMTQVFSSLTPQ